jgi:teichuronic acid biosynthesis glycosyltransferase TuaC
MQRRIALITPILPMPFDQTRGRFIYETARALSKQAQVKVFLQHAAYPNIPLLSPRTFVYGELGNEYRIEGLDVEAFSYPALPVVSRGLNGHVCGHYLTPRLRRFQPDLVLAYWVYPDGFAGLAAARRLKVPCVIGALGSDIHLRTGISHRLTQRTLTQADAVITVSEAMRRFTISEFGAQASKVHTIVNGFNTGIFHPQDQGAARQALGIAPDEQLIIYVGRFVEAKGLKELMTAFAHMAQLNPRARLALIGNGVMQEQLLQLVAQLGLTERVRFPGGLQPQQVAQWIAASNVLTLPSWSEGYPNVVVEGVACGRPVVATDVGGTREILNATNGILIPPKDPQALGQALSQALSHPWDHARIAADMRRTWDDVATETLAVCNSVIQGQA